MAPGEGATVVLDDNCLVCFSFQHHGESVDEKLTDETGDVIHTSRQ
jgi:hypothetical protein